MTKDERLFLNELSTKVYGSPYKWQKMVEKGEVENLTETLPDGSVRNYRGISRYTVEEIKQMMIELDKEEQELKAKEENERSNTEPRTDRTSDSTEGTTSSNESP